MKGNLVERPPTMTKKWALSKELEVFKPILEPMSKFCLDMVVGTCTHTCSSLCSKFGDFLSCGVNSKSVVGSIPCTSHSVHHDRSFFFNFCKIFTNPCIKLGLLLPYLQLMFSVHIGTSGLLFAILRIFWQNLQLSVAGGTVSWFIK